MLQTATEAKNWKYVFIIISVMILIIMPLISGDYGQSGDEWIQIIYGQDIYNYFFNGDKQALDYTQKAIQYQPLQFYGGLFDYLMEIVHRSMPSIPLLTVRHFFNSILGALLMIFTGLSAYRVGGKNWLTGLMALLFMIFSPRIFGESMNNPKDIPFALGFVMGTYYFLILLQDTPKRLWKPAIGLAIGFGLAFGVRPAGGLLLIATFVAMFLLFFFFYPAFKSAIKENNWRILKRSAIFVLGALIVGSMLTFLAWPWGLQSPVANSLESLRQMSNFPVSIRVLFEGNFRPNATLPWYYELKWICISNPLVVITGVALFLLMVLKARNKYGMHIVLFLLFGAFFTPLYMIYKKSPVYDTWRHVFFIYPYWVMMAALAVAIISDYIKNVKLKWVPFGVAALGLLPAIVWTVKSHPNQYIYFNESVGGAEGAFGYYDLDYYQNTGLQHANWIRKNIKPIPGRKIFVASNMGGFERYFAKDTAWLSTGYVRFNERDHKEWDYYVTYGRYISPEVLQNGKWPPANVIHKVKVGDAVLSALIQRKSRASIDAYEAYQKKDFVTAVQKYAEYIRTDATDENVLVNYAIALASIGRIDEAINAINQATAIDSGNPQFYQILAQLYQAKGDSAGAQKAVNQANAIIMREQEYMIQE